MNLRKAQIIDIDTIESILDDAKRRLKRMGIDQWQNGYPNRESILEDMRHGSLYVLCDDLNIYAIATILETPEPTYLTIDGAWGNHGPYITLHRVATAEKHLRTGTGSHLLDAIKDLYPHTTIRIDTHKENKPMRSLLEKNGFTYRGVITLSDGSLRNAYDFTHK